MINISEYTKSRFPAMSSTTTNNWLFPTGALLVTSHILFLSLVHNLCFISFEKMFDLFNTRNSCLNKASCSTKAGNVRRMSLMVGGFFPNRDKKKAFKKCTSVMLNFSVGVFASFEDFLGGISCVLSLDPDLEKKIKIFFFHNSAYNQIKYIHTFL